MTAPSPRRRSGSPLVRRVAVLTAALALLVATPAMASLPDGRSWEQVTPVDKNGGDISSSFGGPIAGVAVSPNGDRVAYFASTPFGDAPAGLITEWLRAERGPDGWASTDLSYPTPTPPNGLETEVSPAFTPDLSHAVFSTPFSYDPADADQDPGAGRATGHTDQYLFGGAAPIWLSRGTQGGAGDADAIFGGASTDLSHVVFESEEGLVDGAPTLPAGGGGFNLYLRTGGQTQLVNVDGSGDPVDPEGAVLGSGTSTGFGLPADQSGTTHNAVSRDGSRVFFESPAPGAGSATPTQVYLRDTAAGTTTDVSAPSAGVVDPGGTQSATYAGAAADGSRVFFVTTQQLTTDDTDSDPDLYAYDVADGTLTRVSAGSSGTADADVQGVTAIADDGSSAYFVAEHPLVDATGTDGAPNLYRYDLGTGVTTFVATLSPADSTRLSDGNDVDRMAYTTADGGVLAFASSANLTTYDAEGHTEIYVYRQAGATLACASCRPDGTPPTGDADFGPNALSRDSEFAFGWPVPLTADGTRVFFETSDSVVPEDANGAAPAPPASTVPGSEDVYEFEGGKVSLLSGGHSSFGAQLSGVSASGDDVFFATRAGLVPQDTDGGEFDIYDARVGGGFATPGGPAPCDGEGCHPGATAPPPLSVPATAGAPGREGAPGSPTLVVLRPSHAAAAHAAHTGRLILTVRISASGRVTSSAIARLGGRDRRVAFADAVFRTGGKKRLILSLSHAARVRLRHHGRLALRIDTTYSRGQLRRATQLTLRRRPR